MKSSSQPRTVKVLENMIRNKRLSLTYPLVRKVGQWNELQMSLLIHSAVSSYPIPPLYTTKIEDTTYIISGIQRITTLMAYIDNQFRLHRETPLFTVNEFLEYDIAEKYFSQLDVSVQKELLQRNINFINVEGEIKEIKDIINRLNDFEPVSASQRALSCLDINLASQIKVLSSHRFMNEIAALTSLQRIKEEDTQIVLQYLMMNSTYKWNDIEYESILDFAKKIEYFVDDKKITEMENLLDYMYQVGVTVKNVKILFKKDHLPFIFFAASIAKSRNIEGVKLNEWYQKFKLELKNGSEYRRHCSIDPHLRVNVIKRKEFVEKHFGHYLLQKNEINTSKEA